MPTRCWRPRSASLPLGVAWSREQLEALPGLTVHDLMLLPIERLRRFFDELSLPSTMLDDALKLLLDEIRTRLKYLCDVGIGYLTLDRQSRTLSGGEVQRINLTTALGTSLVNTMFVLDEPSIGLHPRDMNRIIEAMHRLRDAGNTLVVVEHDPAVMLAADRLIDMGPGPGERGGQIVFDGTPEAIRDADTLTGAYLGGAQARRHGHQAAGRAQSTPKLILEGARDHNLKNVTVEFPLQHLVCVTGVSGSGKSTLMQDVLYPALARHFGKATETPGAHDRAARRRLAERRGLRRPVADRQDRALEPGQLRRRLRRDPQAVRRSRRWRGSAATAPACSASTPATAAARPAAARASSMSRCSSSATSTCAAPTATAAATAPRLLDVKIDRRLPGDVIRDLSVADVLDLTVSEAVQLFARRPRGAARAAADRRCRPGIREARPAGADAVGRRSAAAEARRLPRRSRAEQQTASRQPVAKKGTLFLFDEPTTGLHFDDIAKLMRAFRKLLDAGHSIIVIEHNLDVIRASDWLIDLGPEGGDAGGQVVCTGTPDEVKRHPTSHTGKALADYDRGDGAGRAGGRRRRAAAVRC